MIDKNAKNYAEHLVADFKILLQNEDTDCGQEILCTLIAIRCARITTQRIIDYDDKDLDFFTSVLHELDLM
jgi:hypothetical protein